MLVDLTVEIDIDLDDLLEEIFNKYSLSEIENKLYRYGFVLSKSAPTRKPMINIIQETPLSALDNQFPDECNSCGYFECPSNCYNLENILNFLKVKNYGRK